LLTPLDVKAGGAVIDCWELFQDIGMKLVRVWSDIDDMIEEMEGEAVQEV
jgi:hypothetical protein